MKHSERELRAVNVLALSLTGIGILCMVLVVTVLVSGGSDRYSGKGGESPLLGYMVGGAVFTCSGFALGLALQRVRARGGKEGGPDDPSHPAEP
ncbi:MAG: hypothetical protein HY721_24240 [Planctomycetes bacterium]|nr:hypothetical protein [Planctomycetota bacterium]